MKKPELEAAQTAVDAAQVETSNAWQEAMEEIAYYLSVGVEGCTPGEAVARIKKAATDGARVQMERAERAEAAIAPMVETAQNQQEEIHRLWVTFSKAAEILGLDPQKERRIPRPPSDTFTQAISRLVAERDVALAALKEAAQQEPVAWRHENGNLFLHWQKDLITTETRFSPLYARPVPAAPSVAVPAVPEGWREVVNAMVEWWDDQHMTMQQGRAVRNKARALLQSAVRAPYCPVAASEDQMNIEQLIADLRARINPQYYDQVGTESYERNQCVMALESLMARIDVLRIENAALRADAARIDWLADVDNTVGSVVLPREIVEANISSLRQAIDAARRMK